MSLSGMRIHHLIGFIVFVSLITVGSIAILQPGITLGFATKTLEESHLGSAADTYPYTEVLRGGGLLVDDRTGAVTGVSAIFAGGSYGPFTPELRLLGTVPTATYVRSVRFILASRGAYTGTEELSFEVRGLDGTVKWTISEAPVEIVGQENLVWVDVPLSEDTANNTVSPDEYIAAKVARGGESAGDFFFEIATEVVVSSAAQNTTYLPTVAK